MISLHCTQCKQLLEIDEGFAGGVCRCQHCGTIQTVPKKSSTSGKSSGGKTTSSKTLFTKSGTGTGVGGAGATPGTGLDELAEIVASSGLARGSLTKPPKISSSRQDALPAAAPEAKSGAMLWMLIGAGALILVLVGVVVFMAMRPDPAPTATDSGAKTQSPGGDESAPTPTPETPRAVTGPSFAGLSLGSADSVAFLLDRSQANDDILDAMKAVTYKSIRSLDNRRFQIVFWHRRDEPDVTYPAKGLAPATPKSAAAATKQFEDVVSYGTTELKPTVEKALNANPTTIVVVTAKGLNLEESEVAAVVSLVKDRPVKIHTISLGESESPLLKQIAEQTGGEYRGLSFSKLRGFAQ